jgi:hypothetical protein
MSDYLPGDGKPNHDESRAIEALSVMNIVLPEDPSSYHL